MPNSRNMKDQPGRELELAGYEEGTERWIVMIDLSLSSDSSLIRRLANITVRGPAVLIFLQTLNLNLNPILSVPSPASSLLATAKLENFQAAAMENIFERK